MWEFQQMTEIKIPAGTHIIRHLENLLSTCIHNHSQMSTQSSHESKTDTKGGRRKDKRKEGD